MDQYTWPGMSADHNPRKGKVPRRTSENPLKAKFRERSFHALERLRASRRPGFYALRMTEKRRVMLEPKRRLGYAALGVMERRLKGHDFFVGDRYSIAGNALHGYTHT